MLLEREIEDRPLQLDLIVLLLTCLATSYSNLAAPLVCLDLLEHACWGVFEGQGPDTVLKVSSPPGRLEAAKLSVQTGRATSAPVWTDKSCANSLVARQVLHQACVDFWKVGGQVRYAEPPLAEKLTLGASDLRFLLTNHGIKDDRQGALFHAGVDTMAKFAAFVTTARC